MGAVNAADAVCHCLQKTTLTLRVKPGELTIWIEFEKPKAISVSQKIDPAEGETRGFHEFLDCRRFRRCALTQYFTRQGQKVSLNKFQPQVLVVYPDFMSRTLVSPDQLGPIKNGAKSFRQTVAKYPNAGPLLKRYIEAADTIVSRVNGGEALFNGEWMDRADYEALIRREDEAAENFREQSQEKKRIAAEQARRLDLETRRHKR